MINSKCGTYSLLQNKTEKSASHPARQPWPDGRIPYYILPSFEDITVFSDEMTTRINLAINNWNFLLGGSIRFEPKTSSDTDFVLIKKADANEPNSSIIGHIPNLGPHHLKLHDNPNPILSSGDGTIGVIQHELGHALGLDHEFLRSDRDDHIRVIWENIPSKLYPEVHTGFDSTFHGDLDTPYDIESVMHYSSFWRRPCIRVYSNVMDDAGNTIPWIGGTITKTNRRGVALRIEWDNSIILERPALTEPFVGTPISKRIEYLSLKGPWESNIGVSYNFDQNGGLFEWRAVELNQSGQGSFYGQTNNEFEMVKIFEKHNCDPITPRWWLISPYDVEGVKNLYESISV